MSRSAFLALAAVSALPLLAQIGGGPFPGGGYPPGQSPGSGLPFPFPRKGKQGGQDKDKSRQPVRESGVIRKIDDKAVVVETSDKRVVTFQRTSKTLFYGQDSKEMPASKLKAGDRVSVEAAEDDRGFLSAQKVYLEETGKPEEKPADETPEKAEPGVEVRGPDTAPDPDDPGPPTLKRGVPEPRPVASSHAATDSPSPVAETPADAPDRVIEKARRAAATFSEQLPDYVCQEFMTRYQSGDRPSDWQALDVVSTEVVYKGGHEDYRNITINGRPVHKEMNQLDGSWSTGEFASELLDLFSRSTAAEFRFRKEATVAGTPARVYDFSVDQARSHWHVQMAAQAINPAYKGSLWIDPKTGRVLRLEMQASSLPETFPMDTVESAVDYANIRIGEGQFYLPVHAENLGCQRGSRSCSKSSIDFRNYHKYDANSSITFDNGQ